MVVRRNPCKAIHQGKSPKFTLSHPFLLHLIAIETNWIIIKDMPASKGKALPLLRTINAFLRFLPRTPADLVFRGRVHQFASGVISVADKSAINMRGDYNDLKTSWEEVIETEGEVKKKEETGKAGEDGDGDGDVKMDGEMKEDTRGAKDDGKAEKEDGKADGGRLSSRWTMVSSANFYQRVRANPKPTSTPPSGHYSNTSLIHLHSTVHQPVQTPKNRPEHLLSSSRSSPISYCRSCLSKRSGRRR